MGAVRCAGEIPLLLSFFYLLDAAEANRKVHFLDLSRPSREAIRVQDTVRLGVWLGRHICQMITQVS